ncbi:MAG: hypothetical protein V4534_01500 [Myxococcota bacterium]
MALKIWHLGWAMVLLSISCSNAKVAQKPENSFSYSLASVSNHALDPLSEQELQTAVTILKTAGYLGDGWYLQTLSNAEPEKIDGVYPAYDAASRKAYAVVLHHARNERYELLVDLASGAIAKKTPIKGQPPVMDVEYGIVETAIKNHPEWQQAMTARGIINWDDVYVDTWGPGDLTGVNVDTAHRILRSSFYLQEDSSNPYARPIEGVATIYDATIGQIVKVIDMGIQPISKNKRSFPYNKMVDKPRALDCLPDQFPFIVKDNHEVHWKNWRFKFQLHPREGLVLYEVGLMENGRFRPILDRASLSEMVVPYSDPGTNWYWRAAFDEGDYGLGIYANPLVPDVHYPPGGQVFDATFVDNEGNLDKRANVVAIYERSAGLLWSHWNADAKHMYARSSKELVVSVVFTIGNYDYGLNWIFKENGAISVQAILTGILLTKGHQQNECGRCKTLNRADQFGMLIDQNLIATAHQHFFNFRLDFAVDGPKNSIAEIALDSAGEDMANPYGNVFLINELQLKTEKEALRNPDGRRAKHWWIYNPNQKSELGHYAGYMLDPGEAGGYFGAPDSMVLKAAPFLNHALHVTEYRPEEMHAAGDFPSQNEGEGLPTWVNARNESIVNKDLVVWYTLGVTHLPVLEDWPIMPRHQAGFTLKPMNFLNEAP